MSTLKTLKSMILVGVAYLPVSWAAAPFGAASSVVSLDYCADQYVLKLLPRGRILALSPDSTREFSYLRDMARDHRQVRPIAEDIISLQPDLVVRTYGGGPNITHFFSRLELPVLQIGYADSIKSIQEVVQVVADELGVAQKGQDIVSEMNVRMAALPYVEGRQDILYVTPGGITGGAGTLIDSMIGRAGLDNFQIQTGWHSLPLETLAYRQPEMVATAFYGDKTNYSNFWSTARHPVLQAQLGGIPSVVLSGATTACGGWFIVDAVEKLAAARVLVESGR
ncbi:MAG: ABC transporter substrate-binding protein [Candidatus Azotimanducaceae bacterium WSBS_2022_MAG_OTU7]